MHKISISNSYLTKVKEGKDMIKNFSIAAIIPEYNVELYIEECILSVVNQTVNFDEIIVINDGSTDQTQQIILELCEQNKQIQYYSQQNQGLAAVRNFGMKAAHSEYIMFLDSDDYLDSKTVEILKNKITGQEIIYYSADIKNELLYQKDNIYIRPLDVCYKNMSGLDFFEKTYKNHYVVSACMAIYERRFLLDNQITFPNGLLYEDNFFTLKSMAIAKKVMCIEDKLYIRRYRLNSIMTSEANEKAMKNIITIEKMCQWFVVDCSLFDDYEKLKRTYLTYCIRVVASYASSYRRDTEIILNDCIEELIRPVKQLYDLEQLELNEMINILLLFNYINLDKLDDSICDYYEKLYNSFTFLLDNNLKKTCFNEKSKIVGIYGKGLHTEALLYLYEKRIGRIEAKLCYITSDRKECTSDTFYYTELPKGIFKIIISSLKFQNDMVKNLAYSGVDPNKIVTFYNDNEEFDMVAAKEIVEKQGDKWGNL